MQNPIRVFAGASAASWLFAAWVSLAASASQDKTAVTIDADFPAGNIVVERIEGDQVTLRQDNRGDKPWFYWCFRVRGAAGRTLTFYLTDRARPGPNGPAVSTDAGKTWSWLGSDSLRDRGFVYAFAPDAEDVRFCLAINYLQTDLKRFLDRHDDSPHLKVEHHATTRKGRKTERLRLGRLDGRPEHRVLLTCRHHACEMTASWVLEGIMEAVLADTEDGRWFRRNAEVLVLPFMDKDGVEQGDHGKNRKPHDHNRDYQGESIYPAVAALKEFVPKWSDGKLKLCLDIHCPGGPGNDYTHFVGSPGPETWRRQQQFSRILQKVQTGPLVHDPKNDIPWGKGWNRTPKDQNTSCNRWAGGLPAIHLSVALEIPYVRVGKEPITPESAAALGADLARAVRRYLETTSQ